MAKILETKLVSWQGKEQWWEIRTATASYAVHVSQEGPLWVLDCMARWRIPGPPLGRVAAFPQIPFDNEDAALIAARMFLEFGGADEAGHGEPPR